MHGLVIQFVKLNAHNVCAVRTHAFKSAAKKKIDSEWTLFYLEFDSGFIVSLILISFCLKSIVIQCMFNVPFNLHACAQKRYIYFNWAQFCCVYFFTGCCIWCVALCFKGCTVISMDYGNEYNKKTLVEKFRFSLTETSWCM